MPSSPRAQVAVLASTSLKAAQEAGLRYVGDEIPGATRLRKRSGFVYFGPNGKPIHDDKVLRRILSLVIPPAWTDVWICPHPDGHLQARGAGRQRPKTISLSSALEESS